MSDTAAGHSDFRDVALKLVEAARRAPSSHNSQPWLFAVGENTIALRANPARRLPQSDKKDRQLFLSLGCALENCIVAAPRYGYEVEPRLFSDLRDPWCAASLALKKNISPAAADTSSRLLAALEERRTNRFPFEATPVPVGTAVWLQSLSENGVRVFVVRQPEKMLALAATVADATEAAFRDAGFKREIGHWIKPSLKKYRDGMPGYNIGVPWLVSFIVPFALRHFPVAGAQRKMAEQVLAASPAYVVVASQEDAPAAWVEAGKVCERVWLEATAAGLKMGPLAAGIEIGDHYKKIQQALGVNWRPVFFSRLGYTSRIPPAAPRLALEDILA